VTDTLMVVKDIQTKLDDLLTDFLRDIKNKQRLVIVNYDRPSLHKTYGSLGQFLTIFSVTDV